MIYCCIFITVSPGTDLTTLVMSLNEPISQK